MSLADLSIMELGQGLRARSFSARELTQAHLDRIGQRDGALRAFVAVDASGALLAAARADDELAAGRDRGPLHGIPVGIKDLIDTQDMPTAYGSRAYLGHRPTRDAAVVTLMKEAGAVVLGKLATYEFALVGPAFDTPFAPSVNPRDSSRITGGSSSGCAVAVAGGLLRTSLGTDTGGSIRSPAAYCGAVGLKPTFGAVPMTGIFPLSPSLDHCGPLAASVAEAALTLDCLVRGPASTGRLIGHSLTGVKVAYARSWFSHDPQTDPRVISALDAAARVLADLGAAVVPVELPGYALFEECGAIVIQAEALESHRDGLRSRAKDYGRLALQSLAAGLPLEPQDLATARSVAARLRTAMDARVFAFHDVLLTATTLTPAPALADFDGKRPRWTPMRTLPFNVTGHPALSMPYGTSSGLPVGVQIAGGNHREAAICQVAAALEASLTP